MNVTRARDLARSVLSGTYALQRDCAEACLKVCDELEASQARVKELESHIDWVLADCDPESKERVYDHLREVLGWTK